MSSQPPPGYEQMPPWLADIMEKLSEESKDLAVRSFDTALEAAKERGEEDPVGVALGAVIGICAQMGLNAIAKAIDGRPKVHPVQVANQMAMEIRNSTLLTFANLLQIMNEAASVVKS